MRSEQMKVDGLKRVLDFLLVLQERSLEYRIEQQSPDALMVTFAMVGVRVEVEFSVEGLQYSVFRGDESVDVDVAALMKLIDEKGG
jgi:hypothetical protein